MNNKMNSFVALVKREVIEHKTGYVWVPAILVGLLVLFVLGSLIVFDRAVMVDDLRIEGITNLSEGLMKAQSDAAREGVELGALISLSYWVVSILAIVALPFIVGFSLLGGLYEERRDRSVLFFKSMPVSDTQEVLAKLVAAALVAPMVLLAAVIVGQVITTVVLSLVVLVQGGPVLALLPVGYMINGWMAFVGYYAVFMLWILPILAWLLLVSAVAPRMPFVFALLPIIAISILEKMFFHSSNFLNMIFDRVLGFAYVVDKNNANSLQDFSEQAGGSFINAIAALGSSFASASFWMGIIVAAVFLFGAIEFRKKAVAL